jgi:hypothetical protein
VIATVKGLSLAAGTTLDVTNQAMDVDHDGANSPIAAVRTALASGYAGGNWNGTGIITSNGQTNPNVAVGYGESSAILGPTGGNFVGQSVDGTSLLIRYTLSGDANLDLNVDFNDLAALAQNYNNTDGNRVWSEGDFDYDGKVDFNDLAKMAQNYNTSLPAPAELALLGGGASFAEDVARAFAQVPEPGAITLLGVAAGTLGSRMRRRRRE